MFRRFLKHNHFICNQMVIGASRSLFEATIFLKKFEDQTCRFLYSHHSWDLGLGGGQILKTWHPSTFKGRRRLATRCGVTHFTMCLLNFLLSQPTGVFGPRWERCCWNHAPHFGLKVSPFSPTNIQTQGRSWAHSWPTFLVAFVFSPPFYKMVGGGMYFFYLVPKGLALQLVSNIYYQVWIRNFTFVLVYMRKLSESWFRITSVQLKYGFLSLVSTNSFYKHFSFKNSKKIPKYLTSNKIG